MKQKKQQSVKLDWFDVEELARAILGLDSETDSNDTEEALYEKYEVSSESFHKIVEDLILLTPPAKTALGGRIVHGFMKGNFFIVKVERGEA